MPKSILKVQSISKVFGGLKAIQNCSFEIPSGEITGLIGPNGAGKTTIFSIIAGSLKPTRGQIIFAGDDISSLPPHQRFHKGLVRSFQIPHEFTHLSVIDNLMMVTARQSGENPVRALFSRKTISVEEEKNEARALEVLDTIGLSAHRDKAARNLSGGQLKLLELGRTMMAEPNLILLDEPAAGVNRSLLADLMAVIKQLNEERQFTFVIIEHDMDMVEALSHSVICMAQGTVLAQGSMAEVKSNPEVLESYLGANT